MVQRQSGHPKVVLGRRPQGFGQPGLSWFKPSAAEHIRRMYALKVALEACGIDVEVLTTRDTGLIVRQDEHQIIAVWPGQRAVVEKDLIEECRISEGTGDRTRILGQAKGIPLAAATIAEPQLQPVRPGNLEPLNQGQECERDPPSRRSGTASSSPSVRPYAARSPFHAAALHRTQCAPDHFARSTISTSAMSPPRRAWKGGGAWSSKYMRIALP